MSGVDAVVRRPVYEQVAELLREEVLRGDLAAGTPLPSERDLVDRFKVSRATVREALRALQAQGLLVPGPAAGSMLVAPPSAGPLQDALIHLVRLRHFPMAALVELRCTLEASAVRTAAARRPPELLAAAHAFNEVLRDPGPGWQQAQDADEQFHLALVEAAGNEAVLAVARAVRAGMREPFLNAIVVMDDPHAALARTIAAHDEILAAVEAGDGERAAEHMSAHLRAALEYIDP